MADRHTIDEPERFSITQQLTYKDYDKYEVIPVMDDYSLALGFHSHTNGLFLVFTEAEWEQFKKDGDLAIQRKKEYEA